MPVERGRQSPLVKPLVVLALPGMYLLYKYREYKRGKAELQRQKVTEKELAQLNQKIVSTPCFGGFYIKMFHQNPVPFVVRYHLGHSMHLQTSARLSMSQSCYSAPVNVLTVQSCS